MTQRSTALRSARTLLLWLVLACWLPAVVAIAVLFFHMYQDGRAQLKKTTIETAHALMQVVDGELMRAQAIAQALSISVSLANHDFAGFHQRATALLKTSGIGTNVVLRDESGRQIVNTSRPFGEPLPLQDCLEQIRRVFASGQPLISDILTGGVTGSAKVEVFVPVLSSGRVVYVLGIEVTSTYFNQILLNQHLPSDWITTIFDSTGTIAGRTRQAAKFVGQKLPPDVFKRMLGAPDGAVEAISNEGIPVIVNYSRSHLSHWNVGIGITRKSSEAELVRTVFLLGVGIVILFGSSVGLAWFVGGRIARSVQALSAPALTLRTGKAVAIPKVYFREADEVAKAMVHFTQLLLKRARALRKSYEKLKKSEEALLHSRTRLRKLAERQEMIKEDERKRIARDIHDDLGQNLLVLRMDMSAMAARPDLDSVSRKQVDTMLKQTDITVAAVKMIMNELRPSVLTLGLHAAVEWQTREFERRYGIACEFSSDNDVFVLDDKLATALFRIVQESLTNILRHARASRVQINMQCRDGRLFLAVADDGIGLSSDCRKKEASLGLIGIEERIDALGGKFSIANNADRGTTVTVSIPLAISASEETATTL